MTDGLNYRGRIRAVDLNADLVVSVTLRWIKVENKKQTSAFEHDHFVVLVFSTQVRLY